MKSLLTFLTFFSLGFFGFGQTTLIYSDHESPDEMRTLFLKNVLFPAIEKESKGSIKIEAHWNGELAGSYDALKKVKNGATIDITTVVPEYAANELPTLQIFKSYLVGPTGKNRSLFLEKYLPMYPNLPPNCTRITWNRFFFLPVTVLDFSAVKN